VETIPHLVLANAKRIQDEPAMTRRIAGTWETMTWGEYGAAVQRTARALIASGIEAGDRVAILSYNTPEWVIFHVAAMAIGAVSVGLYFSSSEEEVTELVERSAARVVLTQTAAQIATIGAAEHARLDLIIGTDDAPDDAISWDTFLERGDSVDAEAVGDRLTSIDLQDPATVIFTAAGYGKPIGVVLTHDNLLAASRASVDLFDVTQFDSALSYLPLSHIAEQIFTILAPAQSGYSVAFAQSIGRMRVDLLDIQPTIFFGVPLVWAGFEKAVRKQIDKLEGTQAAIAAWAMKVSRSDIAARNVGRRRSPLLSLKLALAQRLFIDKAKLAMGFSNTRLAFTGAVSPRTEMLEYFSGVGVVIWDVYGLSESAGPAMITREGATRFGTVGLPMPGVEMKLAEDGEILLKGRSMFSHYLDDEEATTRVLRHGWLHTGDLGAIGEDGFLTISGRKKDIIITAGGKNVDALAIEPRLEQDPGIVDAVVVGDGFDQLGVLMAVDTDHAPDAEAALAYAESAMQRVNQRFARAEQVRKVGLLPRPLSVELGERSESGVVQRSKVFQNFASEIENLYRS
jgi:long-chain acyl-CoA synthetase